MGLIHTNGVLPRSVVEVAVHGGAPTTCWSGLCFSDCYSVVVPNSCSVLRT